MKEEVLRIENVTRKVDGVLVLDNINLHIFKGEIMGMMFLTAHGKNELIEIICNNIPIDYGRLYYKNDLVNYYKYSNMSTNPIYVIGQDSRLITCMTVADNIFVMRQGLKKYIINRKQLRNQFYFLFQDIPNSLEPDKLISELTRLERCLVELFRAIVADGKLIIIQDIASFLNQSDLVKFYGYVQYFSKLGIAFLNIGNNIKELSQICDRMALMKNARIVKILDYDELRTIKPYTISYDASVPEIKDNLQLGILIFRQVNTPILRNVSFTIQKGECVVMLDSSNDVQGEFMELIHGKKEANSGGIYYNNAIYTRKQGLRAVINKIMTVDKNPLRNLLFWDMSYLENLCFLIDRKLGCSQIKSSLKRSILDEYKGYVGNEIYEDDIRRLDLGSLYNLIYYRVHLYNPNVLICIQPFTEADMHLRKHIVDLLFQLKKKGITIIIFSQNLEDSLAVADRMLVFEEGQIVKTYEKNEFSHIDHGYESLK